MTKTKTTVTAKPVDSRRFHKGFAALKDAGAKFNPADKTWSVPADRWPQLNLDRDVVALSETPVHKGKGVWVMESTGEEF